MTDLIKKTPARMGILEFLSGSESPVDVSQISLFLKEKKLNTNKVTVYRIIDVLYKNGFIDRLEFGEGKFRYEIKKADHHHFICEKCGDISDISDCNIEVLEHHIAQKKGLLVKRHSLEFFGLCKNCQF